MSTRTILGYNPILFMQELEEAINDGFYADTSIASYPYLDTLCNITVSEQEKPGQRNDLADFNTVVIQGYDSIYFVLDVQDAILQGFYVDTNSTQFGIPYIVTVHRAAQGVLDITPVASDTPTTQDAPQSATEAPTAPKTTRRTKSKEV